MKFLKNLLRLLFAPKYAYLKKFSIRPGDVVIDLGANIGEISSYFLKKHAYVYAYEPNPYAFHALSARVAPYSRVKIYQQAVSNYEGTSKLWLHEDHGKSEVEYSQASSLKAEKDNVSTLDHVEVEVVNIKDVLKAHPRIRLLKVDIEGGEYDIIDDILEYAANIDYVLLETHEKKYPVFAEKGEMLHKKIAASPYRNKFYTDWF